MSWARERRVLVLTLAAALALASVWPLTRLRFDADVLHLMPRDTGAVEAFETYLDAFGSLDALYLYIEAPDGYAIDDYREVVDALARRVRAIPEVARVDAGPLDPGKDWSYLTDRQLLLLDDRTLGLALDRLRPGEAAARVAASRELLALASPDIKAVVQRDPLGWFDLLRPTLGASTAMLQVDPARTDGYVTPDGRAQLLLVHPTEPPFDTDYAARLLAAVSAAEAAALRDVAETLALDELPRPRIAVAGGHRTAVETETLVRGEAISNTLWSSAGILAVLYLAFRNIWVVVFGGLPILLATMVTLGAHQLLGVQLSAAAAGSSAMLFGLGDDGLVLLFVAYRAALARGLTPRQAVAGLGGTGVSILLGAVTTTATFLGLWFMSFPSLQQLGLIVGIGVLLTALFTLTVLVAGLPGPAWAARARDLTLPGLARLVTRRRGVILVVSGLVTVPLGWGMLRLHVDPTLERLRPRGEGFALEEEISARFGLPRDVYIVVDRGPALEPLLARSARLSETAAQMTGLQLSGPTTLLPTDAAQERRSAALSAARGNAAAALDAVDTAARTQGFVPGTFDPFRARLPILLNPDARLTLADYRARGLGDVIGRFVAERPEGFVVATYAAPTSPEALSALEAAVSLESPMVLTGIPIVNRSLATRFPRELAAGLGVGAVVVLLLIWMEFRALRPTLYALVPTVLGLVWGLGALGWAGVVLDLFSAFAVLMFLGIGVDYGIHLVHPTLRAHDAVSPETAIAMVGPAMLLAGLTTLVGFGTLIRSEYVPLYSLGMASVATIGMSLLAALFTLPALLVGQRGGHTRMR